MANITPIKNMGNLPEHGRIRTGIKSGRSMKALDTFRFTSVDKAAIEQLANIYGGTPRPWHDDRANPPDQYEVISEASAIEVAVQPGSVDVCYELWSAGGMQRRCDGEDAILWIKRPSGVQREEAPCVCAKQGVLECKLKTRVNLIFPSIGFAGTWRYESSGETVANTVPGMLAIIEALQHTAGLLPIEMSIVAQERVKHGQKRKFSIVQFRSKVSVDQMLDGKGSYQAQLVSGGGVELRPQLQAVPDLVQDEVETKVDEGLEDEPFIYSAPGDDEIAEAELVDDDGPMTFTAKGDAIRYLREHPGKTMKKVNEKLWEIR
jgi:hypothetical protein